MAAATVTVLAHSSAAHARAEHAPVEVTREAERRAPHQACPPTTPVPLPPPSPAPAATPRPPRSEAPLRSLPC
eukprot:CAMPEP_0183392588 /NCGR_PEP_ID=MMETSP0370-20130417/7286_1 /TAXON_ID=268820 /ORGANISM="Peridinium aciculiferum, Strain PAER-2" /LENGTH=72 /DNA_ID=CAMNT_0025572571 /DNA_START=26 /DNA_END=242 /DNA_ORIENTATION=+